MLWLIVFVESEWASFVCDLLCFAAGLCTVCCCVACSSLSKHFGPWESRGNGFICLFFDFGFFFGASEYMFPHFSSFGLLLRILRLVQPLCFEIEDSFVI